MSTDIDELNETMTARVRSILGKLKEEHEWTQHMLLALAKRIEKLEGVAAEEGER